MAELFSNPDHQKLAFHIFSTLGNGHYYYSKALQKQLDILAGQSWNAQEEPPESYCMNCLKDKMEDGAEELFERLLDNLIISTLEKKEKLKPAPLLFLETMRKVLDETIIDYQNQNQAHLRVA